MGSRADKKRKELERRAAVEADLVQASADLRLGFSTRLITEVLLSKPKADGQRMVLGFAFRAASHSALSPGEVAHMQVNGSMKGEAWEDGEGFEQMLTAAVVAAIHHLHRRAKQKKPAVQALPT